MAASESDRLLSAGRPIDVAGGQVWLRFSLLALKRCEDAYGSLADTITELQWLADQASADFDAPCAGRIAAMLGHVLGADPVDAWSTPAECVEALLDAWLEAFPVPDADPKVTALPGRSPGAPGTGSPVEMPA